VPRPVPIPAQLQSDAPSGGELADQAETEVKV
jgi:hypothetical protein